MSAESSTIPYPNLVLILIGLALLAAPLYIGPLNLDAPDRTFESFEVSADHGAIDYVDDPSLGVLPVSNDLGCGPNGAPEDYRLCGFEAHLADESPEIVVGTSSTPATGGDLLEGRYRYVQVDGEVYRPSADVAEEPVGERYPITLALEPVGAATALADLAVDVDDVSGVVREAAETGSATARSDRDPPVAPIAMADGSYQRVGVTEVSEPDLTRENVHRAAHTIIPILGVVLVGIGLWRRRRHRSSAPTDWR